MKCKKCNKEFIKPKSYTNHRRWCFGIMKIESFIGINLGHKNGMWKGNKVSYGALHDYIKWHFPKTEVCQYCRKLPPYDLANISGKYKRILSDWEWLCRSCHMKKDGRMENLKKYRNKKNALL